MPFAPIRKKLREAIEQYKKNHPEKSDEYREFKEFFDEFASKKTFDTQNINELLHEQYPGHKGQYEYITLLQFAVLLDSVELVRDMLEHGASVHIESKAQTKCTGTSLHFAAKVGNVEIVQLLIDKGQANINAKDFFESTPLHYAAQHGHTNTVEMLLTLGANPNVKNFFGNTPLHYCAFHGDLKMAEMLVKSRAEVNKQNELGDTPLHYCGYHWDFKMAEMLIKSGADINAKNFIGRTAIDNARISHPEIEEYLLGANKGIFARVWEFFAGTDQDGQEDEIVPFGKEAVEEKMVSYTSDDEAAILGREACREFDYEHDDGY